MGGCRVICCSFEGASRPSRCATSPLLAGTGDLQRVRGTRVRLGFSVNTLAHKHTHTRGVAPPPTVRAQRRSRRHVRETIALDSALEDAGRIIWQSCSGITVRFFQCRGHSQTVPRSATGGSNAARDADLTTTSSSSSGKDLAQWRRRGT